MPNTERIEDIISEKAFKQLEKLLNELGIVQKGFVSAAEAAERMDSAVAKSKTWRELEDNSAKATKAMKETDQAEEKLIKTTERLSKAENDLVKSTKARIAATVQDKKALEQISGTLEQNIKLQIRLKTELKQVRDEQKALTKEVASSAASKQALANRTAELAQKEVKLKEAIRQSNLDIRRSVKEQNAAEGSTNQLAARLDRLRAAYNDLSREQKQNIDIGGRLQQQIQALDKEVKESDATLGVYNRNVGNYASALEGVEGPLGTFVGGIQNATTAARAFIATPIGAVIGAIGAALLAARGWYVYNKNLVEATRLTRQLTGLTGDDLKDFRSEVQATATVFNKEYKETLIATNAVAKQFGISQDEALENIRKGFLSGADASGEFLEQLREYPSQLKAVGVTAEETIAIITQNVQQGIYSDKGIDAIKEAGIRIREMTPATKDAFAAIGMNSQEIERGLREGTTTIFEVIKQVSQHLSELPPQSRQVGMAMADIFGGPGEDAGLRYLTTIKDINTNLDETVKEAGELAEVQQDQLEATEKLDKLTAALFDTTGGTFEALIANGKLFLTNVLIGMVQGIVDLINYFVDLYNNVMPLRAAFQLIGLSFETVFGAIKLAIETIINRFGTIGKVIAAALKGDFRRIPAIIREGFQETMNDMTDFGTQAANNFLDSLERTANSRLTKVSVGLDVTGAAGQSTGANNITGGGGGNSFGGDIEQERRLTEARISLRRMGAETAVKLIQKELDANLKLGIDVEGQQKRLAELKMSLDNEATDNALANIERRKEQEMALYELGRELAALGYELLTANIEREQNSLAGQLENIEIRKQHEIEAAHASADSEEEKAARIQIIEAQAQIEREKIERKQRQLDLEKAKFDRMAQVAGIIGNTGRAVTAALPNIPLSIIVGGIGALRLGQLLATPLPQYAIGTENSPEGWALVSERGSEGRIEPSGAFSMTPPGGPALTYLAKGTKIIPHEDMRRMASSTLTQTASSTGAPAFDDSRMVAAQEKTTKMMQKTLSRRTEHKTVITAGGIKYFVKKGGSWKQYIGKGI